MEKQVKDIEAFTTEIDHAIRDMKDGYLFAMMTDKIDLQKTENAKPDRQELYAKALEIRVFNKDREVKWFRADIAGSFRVRERCDSPNMPDELVFWDEYQYLDIDTQKSSTEEGRAKATGGGEYPLPVDDYKNMAVHIRNYLEADEDTGELYVADWRLVGFEKRGGEENGEKR